MIKKREYDWDDIIGCPRCNSVDLEDDGAGKGTRCNECGCVFSAKHVLTWEEPRCKLCRDTGWVIEAKEIDGKVTLEIIPCLIPDCEKSGQEIELISIDDMCLDRVTRHPLGRNIMSLGRDYPEA